MQSFLPWQKQWKTGTAEKSTGSISTAYCLPGKTSNLCTSLAMRKRVTIWSATGVKCTLKENAVDSERPRREAKAF